MRDAPVTAAVASIRSLRGLLADLRAVVIDEASPSFRNRGVVFQRRQILSPQSWPRRWLPPKNQPASRPNRKLPPQHTPPRSPNSTGRKPSPTSSAGKARAKDKAEQEARERIAAEARKAEDERIAAERAALDEERAKFEAERNRLRES